MLPPPTLCSCSGRQHTGQLEAVSARVMPSEHPPPTHPPSAPCNFTLHAACVCEGNILPAVGTGASSCSGGSLQATCGAVCQRSGKRGQWGLACSCKVRYRMKALDRAVQDKHGQPLGEAPTRQLVAASATRQ